jgi:hypothetical protein
VTKAKKARSLSPPGGALDRIGAIADDERSGHNSTDPAEIEALITRLEQGELREGDTQLLGRLLRLLLRLITLLQQKNASLARLKRLLFGLWSDMRRETSPLPVSLRKPGVSLPRMRLCQSS